MLLSLKIKLKNIYSPCMASVVNLAYFIVFRFFKVFVDSVPLLTILFRAHKVSTALSVTQHRPL